MIPSPFCDLLAKFDTFKKFPADILEKLKEVDVHNNKLL